MKNGRSKLCRWGAFLALVIGGVAVAGTGAPHHQVSKKFSLQGFVSDLPDGAYNMRLTFQGGSQTPTFPVSSVNVRNGVFSIVLDGNLAAFSALTPDVFYSSTGDGSVESKLEIETAPSVYEDFGFIPMTSVASAWAAAHADTAFQADNAGSALMLSGVTVNIPSPLSVGHNGRVLKYDDSTKKFELATDNTGAGAPSAGTGIVVNGSQVSVDAGTVSGKIPILGTGGKLDPAVIPGGTMSGSVAVLDANGKIASSMLYVGGTMSGSIPVLNGSGQIPANMLPALANDSVSASNIAANSINTAHIADNQVSRLKLSASESGSDGKFLMSSEGSTTTGKLVWASALKTPAGAADGDFFFYESGALTRLPKGNDGYILAIDPSDHSYKWVDPDQVGSHSGEEGYGNYNKFNNARRPQGGTALIVASGAAKLDATSSNPILFNFSFGNDAGAPDGVSTRIVGISSQVAPSAWTSFPSDSVQYLWVELDPSNNNLSYGYSPMPPMVQYDQPWGTPTAGDHFYDQSQQTMYLTSGSDWRATVKRRIFLGYAIKGTTSIDQVGSIDYNNVMDEHRQSAITNQGFKYIPLPKVWSVAFEAWGPGGGGGGGCGSNGGGGGGGGSYTKGIISVRPGQVLQINIGSPGMGGPGYASCSSSIVDPSQNGGDVSINGTVVAKGGLGGDARNVSMNMGGLGGAKLSGGIPNGGTVLVTKAGMTAGSGSSNGGPGGGQPLGGDGAPATTSTGNGQMGEGPAGGGSGGLGNNSGGNGAEGMVAISY